ncbi:MAG: hypothetical protein VW644_06945 [Alphaproteobacteria bacterium]|jgi:hypothetical protein
MRSGAAKAFAESDVMDLVSKFVPPTALPGLLLLWWLCIPVVGFFAAGTLSGGLVAILSLVVVILFYWASAPLESLFDAWYDGRAGSGLGPVSGQYFPSDRYLDAVREDAVKLVIGDIEAPEALDSIQEKASRVVREHAPYRGLVPLAFDLLGHAARGFVMLALFTAVGALVAMLFAGEVAQFIPYVSLGAALVVALAFIPLGFAGFVYCRWHHLARLYETVAAIESAAEAG